MKRKIAVLVSLVLAVTFVLCSCNMTEKKVWSIKAGEGTQEISCPLEIDGQQIEYNLFRYWYLTLKAQIEQDDSDIDWSKSENREKLLTLTIDEIKYVMAVEEIARENNFELSQEDLDDIDEQMKSVFDKVGGAESYKEILSTNFLTPEVYERMLTVNALYTAMKEELIGTEKSGAKIVVTFEEALESFNKSYYRLASIPVAINYYDDEGNQVDEETYQVRSKQAKAEADKIVKRLKNENFLDVMKDYYDGEQETDTQQYFPVGELSDLVGEDMSKVEIGQYTQPLLSQSTYYIFYRLENDPEYLKKNAEAAVISFYAEEKLGGLIEKKILSYKAVEGENFDKITPETIV